MYTLPQYRSAVCAAQGQCYIYIYIYIYSAGVAYVAAFFGVLSG
jgi:hypothetical protein